MAIGREQKEQQVAELTDKLGRSQLTLVCDYSGLSVAEMQELRALLKDQQSEFKVIKKNLIRRALSKSQTFKSQAEMVLDGQIALAFGLGDEVAVAQVVDKFAKTHPQLEIKSALSVEGQLMTADEVKRLASLPSRDQLRAILVGGIAAPLSGFANVLRANLSGLVNIFNQLKEQKV